MGAGVSRHAKCYPLVSIQGVFEDLRGEVEVSMALRVLRDVVIYQSDKLNSLKLPIFDQFHKQ